MIFDNLGDPNGFVPERNACDGEVLFDDIGVVGNSPGPALDLFVLIGHGGPEPGGFGGVGKDREEERLDFDLAFVVKVGFEKETIVFGDNVGVPVTDVVDHF